MLEKIEKTESYKTQSGPVRQLSTEGLATKPDDQNSLPWSHTVGGKRNASKLSFTCALWYIHDHPPHTQTGGIKILRTGG